MKRIRVEWSAIWGILGPHVEQILTHHNTQISYFALDKLRQMSSKFLEIEELENFSFQKDFLHPFACGVGVGDKIGDMSLTCLLQIIQSKANRLKSGWKAILAACTIATKVNNGTII
jgi:brefeldin A-inhibited guanine nucleotide-exchange protein